MYDALPAETPWFPEMAHMPWPYESRLWGFRVWPEELVKDYSWRFDTAGEFPWLVYADWRVPVRSGLIRYVVRTGDVETVRDMLARAEYPTQVFPPYDYMRSDGEYMPMEYVAPPVLTPGEMLWLIRCSDRTLIKSWLSSP